MLHSVQVTLPVLGAITARAAFGGYDADCMDQLSQGPQERPHRHWRSVPANAFDGGGNSVSEDRMSSQLFGKSLF
jgi:hypothetical protein